MTWWTPFIAFTFLIFTGAVFRLWRWFYTEEGRRIRHAMITEYVTRDLLILAARAQAEEEILKRSREQARRLGRGEHLPPGDSA